MKIKELFKQKQSDLQKYKPVTIAFLGIALRKVVSSVI